MVKVLITSNQVEQLFKWKEAHTELLYDNNIPFKDIEINCDVNGSKIIYRYYYKKPILKVYMYNNDSKKASLTGKFKVLASGKANLIKSDTRSIPKEKEKELFTDIYSMWKTIMALFKSKGDGFEIDRKSYNFNDNSTKTNKVTSTSLQANKKNTVTYIVDTHNKQGICIKPKGSRNSPHGEFGVRGHYRHYSSGKVVWIKPFLKGKSPKSKKKNKTYRL